jgi:lipopolysaccharide export system permease protein
MQSLWKYLPELVGKGIEFLVILEFITYLIPHIIPFALPLTILISSIMTFGNLGERYELVAIKSAGIGLVKMMMPLTLIMVLLAGATFYSANVLIPKANLQWGALLYDMVQKKPAMNISDGVFFKGIDGYAIRVGKKHKDNKTLEDILIYTRADDNLTNNVIIAKMGFMDYTEDKNFLLLELYDGKQYNEMVKAKDYHKTMPHNVMKFEKYFLAIDLSDLELSRTNPQDFRDDYRMLGIKQLNIKLDSFDKLIVRRKMYLNGYMAPFFHFEEDSTKSHQYGFDTMDLRPYSLTIGEFEKVEEVAKVLPNGPVADSIVKPQVFSERDIPFSRNLEIPDTLSSVSQETLKRKKAKKEEKPMDALVLALAIRNARNLHSEVENAKSNIDNIYSTRARYDIEKQNKYALAFSCLLLFFVGAPLGAIIRRGGFGLPLVLAIVLFIVYYIINEIGAKMARQGVFDVWVGVWLSTLVLLPVAIFLTVKANSDSKLFDMDSYKMFFNKIFRWRKA